LAQVLRKPWCARPPVFLGRPHRLAAGMPERRSPGRGVSTSPAGSWRRGSCWFLVNDPCGWVCVIFTYAVTLGTAALTNLYFLLPRASGLVSVAHLVGYNYTIALMLVSHARCMLTNPGTARDYLDEDLVGMMRWEFERVKGDIWRATQPAAAPRRRGQLDAWPPSLGRRWWCERCDTFRPRHTHHCRVCRGCVLEMDHHCPWVNNCVGWRNHKYFLLFISYAWIGCVWTPLIFINALRTQPLRHIIYDNVWMLLWCVVDAVVCFLLAIFTCAMGLDQWDFMERGYGVIGVMQRRQEEMEERRAAKAAAESAAQNKVPDKLGALKGDLKALGDSIAAFDKSLSEATARQGKGLWSLPSFRCPRCQICGDRLPAAMGESLSFRWILPMAPPNRARAVVPEKGLIASVRERYCEPRERLPLRPPSQCTVQGASYGGKDVVAGDLPGRSQSMEMPEVATASPRAMPRARRRPIEAGSDGDRVTGSGISGSPCDTATPVAMLASSLDVSGARGEGHLQLYSSEDSDPNSSESDEGAW